MGFMSNNNIAATVLAMNARKLGKPADILCDALRLSIGGAWHPICAHCLCLTIDPGEALEAHRAADRESYCSVCSYVGIDVLAVDVLT